MRPVCTLSITALIALSTPAVADVTASDVWADWQRLAGAFGQTLTAASEEMAGDTLTLGDVRSRQQISETIIEGSIPEVRLVEQDDGTVILRMSETYGATITMPSAEGDGPVTAPMQVRQAGLTLVASGDPGAIGYTFTADRIDADLTGLSLIDADGQGLRDATATLTATGLTGDYGPSGQDAGTILATYGVDTMSFRMTGTDIENGGSADIAYALTGLSTSASVALPPDVGTRDGSGPAAETDVEVEATFDASTFDISGTQETGSFAATGRSGAGRIDLRFGPEGLRYGGENTDWSMSLTLPELPLPSLEISAARSGAELRLPTMPSDDAQPFGINVSVEGLSLTESVWTLFDPAGIMPRDPADLVLDVSGTGIMNADWFNADAVADPATQQGTLETLVLDRLRLSAVGAVLTGAGRILFDTSKTPPAPDGQVDLQFVGLNALLDRLVQLGVLPPDQVTGARFMIGMFTQPGTDDDTVTSRITVQPDWSVYANGQRIR